MFKNDQPLSIKPAKISLYHWWFTDNCGNSRYQETKLLNFPETLLFHATSNARIVKTIGRG